MIIVYLAHGFLVRGCLSSRAGHIHDEKRRRWEASLR